MSRREKLIEKMRLNPASIRYAEVETLLRQEGFVLFNSRGSHRTYHRADGRLLTIVRPHGGEEDLSSDRHSQNPGGPRAMTTSHDYRQFVFTIAYRSSEPAYIVEFPDIPDIITSGGSLTAAFANACEALDLHLESLQKLSLPLPQPRHRLLVEASETA